MKKVIKYITDRYYLFGGLVLDLAALKTLLFEGASFQFWMLCFAAVMLAGMQDIIDNIKNR